MEIAIRELIWREAGNEHPVRVRLFSPAKNAPAWECNYEIDWPHGTNRSSAAGVDAIQALELALQKIGIEIYTSEYHRTGQLVWMEPGDGYGFPLSPSMRDLYQGADRLL